MKHRPRRIVIVKCCCLGDGLMSTAAIAALSQSYPDLVIHVASGRWTRPAYATSPRIHALLDTRELLGGRRPSIPLFARLVSLLRGGRYDTAITFERSFWVGLLPLVAGIGRRVGLDSGGRGWVHTDRVPVGRGYHEAQLYLDCAAALGARATQPRMEYRVPAGLVGGSDGPYALIHPGGGVNPGATALNKRWPPERFGEIARRLEACDVQPLIVGAPSDRDVVEGVLAASGGVARAAEPGPALPNLAALTSRARVYVGNDSGPTHLAVAVGTPTVAIFGPTDERVYGPFGLRDDGQPIGEAVAAPLIAAGAPGLPALTRSTESVSVDHVWAAVERALAKSA